MRLATSQAAIERAVKEAKVYEQLKHLQGRSVPRLLEHGCILEGEAYSVATEFVEVHRSAASRACPFWMSSSMYTRSISFTVKRWSAEVPVSMLMIV